MNIQIIDKTNKSWNVVYVVKIVRQLLNGHRDRKIESFV